MKLGFKSIFDEECVTANQKDAEMSTVAVLVLIHLGHQSANGRCDLLDVRFEREMSGIQQLDRGIGIITAERLGAGRKKERVMLSPDGKQRRFGVAKVLLKNWIEGPVRSVVEKQIELNVFVARTFQ